MKLIRILILNLVAVLCFTTAGCKSMAVENAATVVMDSGGYIYVGGKFTGLKKMVKQLKHEGYSRDYTIIVQIPQNTSQRALSAIGRELASNGYPHFLFRHERKAKVLLGPDPMRDGIQETVPHR